MGDGVRVTWWRRQLEMVRSTLVGPPGRRRPARRGSDGPIEIGILSVADPTKGVWRVTQCLVWALALSTSPPRLPAGGHLSVFCCRGLGRLGRNLRRLVSVPPPEAVAWSVSPGVSLESWSRDLDHVVLGLPAPVEVVESLLSAGLSISYVPYLDWPGCSTSALRTWTQTVIGLQQRYPASFDTWAQTPGVAARLREVGIASALVPWSIPDPVNSDRVMRQDTVVNFLINAGMGGWQGRRGVDIALHAFMLARSTTKAPIRLTIKTIRPCRAYLPSSLHAALMGPDVRVIEGFVGRDVLNDLHRGADAVLYPSRWDGFGFALLEALHAGVPVLATDGYPMNELVRDDHTGLLIPARQVGWTRLAPHWEPEVERLADAMRRIADDFELRRRLTCADAGALIDRQETFRRAVRGRLLSDARVARGTI